MRNNRKIDTSEILNDVMDWIENVSTGGKSTSSYKTTSAKKRADKIRAEMYDANLSLNYYRDTLTQLRSAIRDTNHKHHTVNQKRGASNTIPYLKAHYKKYADALDKLITLPNDKVEAAINDIKEQVKKDDDLSITQASDFLAALKVVRVFPEIFYHLIPNTLERERIKDNNDGKLKEKKQDTIKLSKSFVDSTIKTLLASDSYTALAFGLALASGRRATEILFTAEFKKVNDASVEFSGQLKRRAGIAAPAYTIPLLIPTDEFLKAFDKLRAIENVAKLNEKENTRLNREDINSLTANALNERAKSVLFDIRRTFKDSRAIYTRYCLEFIRNKENGSDEDHYAKELLGHTSYAEQVHYKQFIITTEHNEEEIRARKENYLRQRSAKEKAKYKKAKAKTLQTPKNHSEKIKRGKSVTVTKAMESAIKAFVAQYPNRKRMLNLHEKIVEWVITNPDRPITQTGLSKKERGGIGGNRNAIKDYLEITADAIKEYNEKRA